MMKYFKNYQHIKWVDFSPEPSNYLDSDYNLGHSIKPFFGGALACYFLISIFIKIKFVSFLKFKLSALIWVSNEIDTIDTKGKHCLCDCIEEDLHTATLPLKRFHKKTRCPLRGFDRLIWCKRKTKEKSIYLNKLSKNKVMQPQFSCKSINSKTFFVLTKSM